MTDRGIEMPPSPRGTRIHTSAWMWAKARFVTGVRIIAPFVITWLVVRLLYDVSVDLTQPAFRDWFGQSIPGLGFAIILGAPFIVGLIGLYFLGARAIVALEAFVSKVPIIGPTFAVSRQLVSAFAGGAETGFRRVVEIEYPRPRIWSLGFLTETLTHDDGELLGMVYVPTTPVPNSGFTVLVPMSEIRDTNLRTNDLMRIVLSAGVSSPDHIERRIPDEVSAGFVPSGPIVNPGG